MIDRTQPRRLYRSRTNVVFCGIAGGMGEYFNVDPTLTRVLLFLALLTAGPFGLLIYVVLALIIPAAPESTPDA
jgi:phage shock protein C